MSLLTGDQQIEKLAQAMRLANDAAVSKDLATRLGALVIYAGIVDFLVIQAARLVEQVMLKSQLADGIEPGFAPSGDEFFYSRKVVTGRIIGGIRKLLPFQAPADDGSIEAERITKLARRMVADASTFLAYRNPLLHQIGDPTKTFEDVLGVCDQAIAAGRRMGRPSIMDWWWG